MDFQVSSDTIKMMQSLNLDGPDFTMWNVFVFEIVLPRFGTTASLMYLWYYRDMIKGKTLERPERKGL